MSTRYQQYECRTDHRQLAEDPTRQPHEKETTFHLQGDDTHFSVVSFKRVVFAKLLKRPEFNVEHVHVLKPNKRESTVDSLDEATADPTLTIIGVTGHLPVGAMNIGTSRNSNSHADIVK